MTQTGMALSEEITVGEKTYTTNILLDRDLGPGVRYTRMRMPDYPLNINMLRIDLNNPYNSVETTQGQGKLYSTEGLAAAASRQTTAGHVALAGANANFWCVAQQPPYSEQINGATYNGNLVNGKIVTETNCYSDQWDHGPSHTGILGITPDKKAYSGNNWTWKGFVTSAAGTKAEIISANKLVRENELTLYNDFYPSTRTFRCVNQEHRNNTWVFDIIPNCATEVYLTLDEGQEWSAGNDMTFTVMEIKKDAGNGTRGDYDAVLVGRGDKKEFLNTLSVGEKITVNYAWVNPQGNPVVLSNLVGGNAQVMQNGEMLSANDTEEYNSMIYSRTGYGVSADGKTLYIIVIDKSTDPIYGTSAGCNTRVMCSIAKHFGCVDMTNFDAGGSAEMFVKDRVINQTTEATPRAVANGMLAYSIAPEDGQVARLEFWDVELVAPIYSTYQPRIIAYNKYGAVIDDDFKGYTLSCPAEAGKCEGSNFTAGSEPCKSVLTASVGNVSVSKNIDIRGAELTIRIKPVILIDANHSYKMEVISTVDGNTYYYNPADIAWSIDDTNVATIDANGIVTGVSNGETTIKGEIGQFSDVTTIRVQNPIRELDPLCNGKFDTSVWKVTKTGSLKLGTITPAESNCGVSIDYTAASRSPKITLANRHDVYGLPEALVLVLNPGNAKISKIVLSLVPGGEGNGITRDFTPALEANKDNTVTMPLSEFGDITDLSFYPLVFRELSFTTGDSSGARHLDIKGMYFKYKLPAGVEDITADNAGNGPAQLYNLQGMRMSGNPAPGLYIRRQGNKATKVIIR